MNNEYKNNEQFFRKLIANNLPENKTGVYFYSKVIPMFKNYKQEFFENVYFIRRNTLRRYSRFQIILRNAVAHLRH